MKSNKSTEKSHALFAIGQVHVVPENGTPFCRLATLKTIAAERIRQMSELVGICRSSCLVAAAVDHYHTATDWTGI